MTIVAETLPLIGVRIINISDLHFRSDWHEESEYVWSKFCEDLAKIVAEGRTILIFSGDIVQAGDNPDDYSKIAEKLIQLRDSLKVAKTDLIAVPGNLSLIHI